MPYLNRYNKTEQTSFQESKVIGNARYAVGAVGNDGLVTKLAADGSIIWERHIKISNTTNLVFNQVSATDTDDIIVLGTSDTTRYSLTRLKATGDVVWTQLYSVAGSTTVPRFFIRMTTGRYFLVFQQSNSIAIAAIDDSTGAILNQRRIDFSVNGIFTALEGVATNGSRLMLYGTQVFIELDASFNLINRVKVSSRPGTNFRKVEYDGNNAIIYGFSDTYYIARFAIPTNPVNVNIPCKLLTGIGDFTNNGTNIYLHTHISGIHRVYKLTPSNLAATYTKRFDTTANLFLESATGTDIYLRGSGADSFLGRVDTNLTSCKTVNEATAQLTDKALTFYSDFNATITNAALITPSNATAQYGPLNSVIEQLCPFGVSVSGNIKIQSPHLYLQAAGSPGTDSTKGVHLRWLFKNALANHLPKANYAVAGVNFNKANDYVKVYRTPYIENKVILGFSSAPGVVNDSAAYWIYAVGTKMFYIRFINISFYAQVRATINPTANAQGFVNSYSQLGGIIEIENQNELAFAVTPRFNSAPSSNIKIELLSVEENTVSAPKYATLRKTYAYTAVHGVKRFSENIRSVRLRCAGTYPIQLEFEYYSNFIATANAATAWSPLGDFALTLDDDAAFLRLEPQYDTVNGKWLRYNDSAYVNAENYKTRWNTAAEIEERIKPCVQAFITLTNNANNPEAIEVFDYPSVEGVEPDTEEASTFEISNLFVLQAASMDFHIARMLGLGTLDTVQNVYTGQYVYMAEYVTIANLQDGQPTAEVKHLYCSLPTALTDQRLPIPVELKVPVPGIFNDNYNEGPSSLTDAGGYSPDGKTRFITLFNKPLPDEAQNASFFYKEDEFVSSDFTIPVYGGIEYKRTADALWRKPELPFSLTYLNIDNTVTDPFQKSETRSILLPDDGYPLFIHREKQGGWHTYGSYGVNWFSRAASSSVTHNIETIIIPANELQPPTNVNAVLVQEELPLLLTSAVEQDMLGDITGTDKTLARVSFDYNHAQELIVYKQKIGNELVSGYAEFPDNEEPFADELELFFRNTVPHPVSGKISVVQNDADPLLAVLTTAPYVLTSTATNENDIANTSQSVTPQIPAGKEGNYIGAVLQADGNEYIIQAVNNTGTYPQFTVFKRALDGTLVNESTTVVPEGLQSPETGSLFLVVENMQNPLSWNNSINTNPLQLRVAINHTTVHRETIVVANVEGVLETYLHKFRGIYRDAVITKVIEQVEEYLPGQQAPVLVNKHNGLYEITFTGYTLPQHTQFAEEDDSVEFAKGVVRIHTFGNATAPRKELQVVRAVNIGVTGAALKIYASDPTFPATSAELATYDGKLMADAATTVNQKVNYYPGYKVYLYANATHGFTETNLLPGEDQDVKYSVFGLRSHDFALNYFSPLSVPALMYAKKIQLPQQPQLPSGGLYATRPDFFGKATYTFTTKFMQKPYSVQFGRASDIQIITTLYDSVTPAFGMPSTVRYIMDDIFKNGSEPFYVDRWMNLLGFTYSNGNFNTYEGVALPMPNSQRFIEAINDFIDGHNNYYPSEPDVQDITTITALNQVIIPQTPLHGQLTVTDFIKQAVWNCFVPLTEIPVIYQHIKDNNYTPQPKKQVVRDRNGNLLSPSHPDFDMAPMMKVASASEYRIQFTDFGLDGASSARYFYAAKEINLQMRTSIYSPILGPISMVNSSAPPSPDIVKVLSVLENRQLGTLPAIQFTINAYPQAQGIVKINVYRTLQKADALSVRTMPLVKEIEIDGDMADARVWTIYDDFDDLPFVPFGDTLYYRLTVSREIKYTTPSGSLVTDYAPSSTSELMVTNVVNNAMPESPVLSYYSEPENNGQLNSVILSWEATVYNGKYHVYKMNTQGNWVKLQEVVSNAEILYLPVGNLTIEDANGSQIYHHYKVLAENYSGMISTNENMLTIYQADTWQGIGGIGDMIIEGTFIVR